MRIGQHDTHPAADTLPLMEGADLAGLVDDIKVNGQRERIVLLGSIREMAEGREPGLILDGRNRYRACLVAKVEPQFRYFDPAIDGDPVAFVISANLARRDLDAWDRAATAQRLVALIGRERKKASKAGPRLPGITDETAAMAKTVTDDGVPELVEALDAKVIDLPSAAAVAGLEPELQRRAVEKLTKTAQDAMDRPEPARPKKVNPESMQYPAGELSPTDCGALRDALAVLERNPRPSVGFAAGVIRRCFPGLASD